MNTTNWDSRLKSLLILLLVGGFCACELIDPPEDEVTILHVPEFQVVDSSTKKSLALPSSVFAFAQGKSIGTFALPAKIPVVSNTDIEVRLIPGITRNGTIAYQSIYNPYYDFVFSLSPQNGRQIEVRPVTGFRNSIKQENFLFEEDFDSSNQLLHLGGDTTFSILPSAGCTNCGARMGRFTMTDQKRSTVMISNSLIARPSKETYLELHYKNSVNFEVGVTLFDGSGNPTEYYLAGFKPKNEWNKVYIPLNDVLALDRNTTQFLILLKVELAPGETSGIVDMDNMRVVAF